MLINETIVILKIDDFSLNFIKGFVIFKSENLRNPVSRFPVESSETGFLNRNIGVEYRTW